MAKRKNDLTSPVEDYIEQLNWQADHSSLRGGLRNRSVHYEPKWKYKIGYRYPSLVPFGRIIAFGLMGLVVYLIFSSKMETGEKIFSTIMFGLILLVFFFASRGASKNHDNNSKHLD